MGVIVIVGYRPKPGKEKELDALMLSHVQRLRVEGLATLRESVLMKAQDGTVVEVFEWASQDAMDSAHSNPEVLEMWQEYSEVCEYVPLGELAEAQQLFAQFASF
jgi:quinol monooxygenase YgiN